MNESQHFAVLGFDYGKKRIGIAVGQTLTGTATALTTLTQHGPEPDWSAIGKLIATWHPGALVVGLPLNMDGTPHAMTEAAQQFAAGLKQRYGLPVHRVDERLSSIEAERALTDRKRHPRPGSAAAKKELDRASAQLILQDWLEQRARACHDSINPLFTDPPSPSGESEARGAQPMEKGSNRTPPHVHQKEKP